VVFKTYYVYIIDSNGERSKISERCATPNMDYGDQRTVRTYYLTHPVSGEANSGQIKSILYPDTRMDSYTYTFGTYHPNAIPSRSGTFTPASGSYLQATVIHGTMDQPDGIAYKTTREVTIPTRLAAPWCKPWRFLMAAATSAFNGACKTTISKTAS
jgi:hypothetical protein